MKKLLFGLVATLFFGLNVSAQKITKEDLRLQLSKSMVSLVDDLKPNFKKGMNYENFKDVILAGNTNSTIPTTGEELLKKAYSFISKNITNDEILKTYEGTEMANVFKIISNSKDLKEGAIKVFGENFINKTTYGQDLINNRVECCRWLLNAFNWIWENHNEIITIICMFVKC